MTASDQIDQLIAKLIDWRGKTLASIRKTILAADPEISEEWKRPASTRRPDACAAGQVDGSEIAV